MLTMVQSFQDVQHGLTPFLAATVANTPGQLAALIMAILRQQHLSCANSWMDKEPAGRNGMRALRAPAHNALGRAMHNSGQGLHAQVGFVLQHARHDYVSFRWCTLWPTQRLGEEHPLFSTGHASDTRAWHNGVELTHARQPSTTCTTPDHLASPRGLFDRNWWMCCSAFPANSESKPKTNETPPRHKAFECPQLGCVLLAACIAGVLVRRCCMLVDVAVLVVRVVLVVEMLMNGPAPPGALEHTQL